MFLLILLYIWDFFLFGILIFLSILGLFMDEVILLRMLGNWLSFIFVFLKKNKNYNIFWLIIMINVMVFLK